MTPPESIFGTLDSLVRGVCGGDRATLGRAITLVESRRDDHRALANALIQNVLPRSGSAIRLGITGAPGAGKSTMIEALGGHLVRQGRRVAVLAVDPSSARTGGSILGDKTRMERLAADPNAFIRPSPSAGTMGGVAARTREAMLLCEAAGYGVIVVETVGIGQSETAVADMTDCFLALMLPGAGDELQGLKKGLIELADMIVVNKADGDNAGRARAAAAEYRAALHILTPASAAWSPPVLTCSALTGDGVAEIWSAVLAHRDAVTANGDFAARRRVQQVRWMWSILEDRWRGRLTADATIAARLADLEAQVSDGRLSPALAADELAKALRLS